MSIGLFTEKGSGKLIKERVIGEYSIGTPGPTLVCFCGLHGNEPSGVIAFQKVLRILKESDCPIQGKLVGFVGNRKALKKSQRFIDQDMNRIWSPKRMQEIEFGMAEIKTSEDKEQRELLKALSMVIKESKGDPFFIDLHTTSSESQPYISINDTLRNRRMALNYPLPIVLGTEEFLEGTILNYINELGHIALGFEAGQHDNPASVINHEAIIWLSLVNSGCLDHKDIRSELDHQYAVLSKTIVDGKSLFELRHRHWVGPEDKFEMKPGYVNFQSITKSEQLAHDRHGPIISKEKGRIFMPLYQKQGNDGFFIIRKIKWFWLQVSAILRRTRFHRFLHFLPGVGKYNRLSHTLRVNTTWARWYVIDFFHLMGFRRKKVVGKRMIFIKREHDVKGPV